MDWTSCASRRVGERETALNLNLKKRGCVCTCTYITLQIFAPRVALDADQVPEHARHDVVAKDDDLLAEEFQTARVARQVDVGDLGPQPGGERGQERFARQDRVDGQVEWTGYEDEVGAARYEGVGCDQIR